MFERYTEHAKRIIFFSRYEASQFGSPQIDTEHLLLGLLREEKALSHRFILRATTADALRRKIEAASPVREKISTSVDMPLSHEAKEVLDHAADEANRLSSRHIGAEHLLLGLLREEACFAAQLLREGGLRLESLRAELTQTTAVSSQPKETPLLSPVRSNLTLAADTLNPFIGRTSEMERMIQVLGRSSKNCVALVGPSGVGKRAMVEGLARRIAEGNVPPFLAECKLLDFDVVQLLGPRSEHAREILRFGRPNLFFMEEFISQLISSSASAHPLASEGIKALLLEGRFQCICSASAEDYERATSTHPWLESCFSVVEIPPMTENDATAVLISAQKRLEMFHGLTINHDVMMDAVRYSATFIRNRALPEKALDLVDEAAAHARARQRTNASDPIRDARKRIRAILNNLEDPTIRRNVEEVQHLTEEERSARKELNSQLEQHKKNAGFAIELTRQDVEEVVSQWTGIPLEQIQKGSSAKGKRARKK